MNARELNFPALPTYTATWAALYFEPMQGSGERITCGLVLRDSDGTVTRSVTRDDVFKTLFGTYRDHVQEMIDLALTSLARYDGPLQAWRSPVTGFALSSIREGRSQQGREGVFRQAVKLAAAFAQLDYPALENDELPALEMARTFIGRVRQEVVATHAHLDAYFQKSTPIIAQGAEVQFGFLMERRAAHFEILRPSTISTSIKFARGKLYELKKARNTLPLERAVLIIGVPHADDLGYSPNQHKSIARELAELRQEAQEDDTDAIPVTNDAEAAIQVIDLAT